MSTIGLGGLNGTTSADGFGEVFQSLNGHLPADTGIGDTDTLLETGGTLRGHLLVTLVDIRLEHDTDNGVLAFAELLGQFLSDQRLVAVVLVGIAVRAVHHDHFALLLSSQSLASSLDVAAVVVGALATTTEDDEAVLVARGLGDGCQTLLGDTQETVGVSGSANGVNGNRQVPIRAVLVSNWETETGSKLTVQLRLGGTGSNGTKRDEVGQVLWRDGVQHFTGNGHAGAGQVGVELTGDAQTLVDVVGLVNVRVVDQTLPSYGRTGLFEVGTHDDAEVARKLPGEFLQTRGILDCGGRVMDGARTDDNEQTVIALLDDLDGLVTTRADGLNGMTRLFLVNICFSPSLFYLFHSFTWLCSSSRTEGSGNDSQRGSRTEGTEGRAMGRIPGL